MNTPNIVWHILDVTAPTISQKVLLRIDEQIPLFDRDETTNCVDTIFAYVDKDYNWRDWESDYLLTNRINNANEVMWGWYE